MHKSKNKLRVRFVGNNSENVTGSCVLIETETKKILVECGLYQGDESLLEQYKINSRKFNFKINNCSYFKFKSYNIYRNRFYRNNAYTTNKL